MYFDVYEDRENMYKTRVVSDSRMKRVQNIQEPSGAAKYGSCHCNGNRVVKDRAFEDISANIRVPTVTVRRRSTSAIPAQSTRRPNQVDTRSIRTDRGDESQRNFSTLCQREIKTILHKDQHLRPLFSSTMLPKSANSIQGSVPRFTFDHVGPNDFRNGAATTTKNATLSRQRSVGSSDVTARTGAVSRRVASTTAGRNLRETNLTVIQQQPTLNRARIHSSTKILDVNHDNIENISPIPPNCFTTLNTLIMKMPEKKREPKLKMKSLKSRSGPTGGDLYTEEYLDDIIRNFRYTERRIVLPENFLQKYNPDIKCRAAIVNWMLRIQALIVISDAEYYLAVNLFDQILARVAVPPNMLQLLAISAIWIANKNIGSDKFSASSLVSYCEDAYMVQQLLKMEIKIMKIMDFRIHTIEPTVCANYYLKLFNIDQLDIAKLSVYYILDCATLLPEFSSTPTSIVASAAVLVALKVYYKEAEENLSHFFNQYLSADDLRRKRCMESQIYSIALKMTDESFMFKEPFYKYNKGPR